MENRLMVQSQTFAKFGSDIAESYRDAINNNSNLIGYPLMLDDIKNKKPSMIPGEDSIEKLKLRNEDLNAISVDDIIEKKRDAAKPVEITYGTGEQSVSLKYRRIKLFYNDSMTGLVKTISLPELAFDPQKLNEYFLFVAKFAEAFLEIYQFTNIIVATNDIFLNKPIPGTGAQLFERLTGTSGLLTIEPDFYQKAYDSIDPEKIRQYMNKHNESKEKALVSDFLTRNILSKYSKNMLKLSNITKDLAANIKNKEAESDIKSSDTMPQIKVTKESNMVEIGSNRRDNINSISTLYNL